MFSDTDPLYGAKQWFCIRTKPKCEDSASLNIAMKDILVFNPKIEELYNSSKRIVPLFPSYIFANFSLANEYYKIVWTPGVKHVLGCGNGPVPLEDEVIYLIMDRMENRDHIKPKFKPGDRVKVKDGVFSGLVGIFETCCPGKERVRVLLALFRQTIKAEFDLVNLEKVSEVCS